MHILYTNPKQGPFVKSKQPLNVVCKYYKFKIKKMMNELRKKLKFKVETTETLFLFI